MTTTDGGGVRCDRCDGVRTPIAYGYPGPELVAAADHGEVVLGGCIVWDGMPRWHCPTCDGDAEGEPPF